MQDLHGGPHHASLVPSRFLPRVQNAHRHSRTIQDPVETSTWFEWGSTATYGPDRTFATLTATGIGANAGQPLEFRLGQTYPNTFNPLTVITYDIPVTSHVMLTVYDVLGSEIKTLANDTEQPGSRSVTFDAQRLGDGLYCHRLNAGAVTMMKKMVVMK